MSFRKAMPKNARRVFQGVIFEVWQWQQKMFDGSTATFERLKRPDTAEVIPVIGDRILLLEEQQPDSDVFYSFPCGRREDRESPEQAARRELREETGYEGGEWSFWKSWSPAGKIEWTSYFYIAHNPARTASPTLDPGEKITPHLIDFDELLSLSEDPKFRETSFILDLLRARLDPQRKAELHQLLFGR